MQTFEQLLIESINIKVLDTSINYNDYIEINLSIDNEDLNSTNLQSSKIFENYINTFIEKNSAKVAFGGYNETRNLYKRSAIFNEFDKNERNIHIGLDLWIDAETIVLAALDGVVLSFKNNTGLGNYGPTIILEHQVKNYKFYTLYGHLSLECISKIKIGDFYKKGQILAKLGDSSVNGDYAPHLHFQIIKDIQDFKGDYPGVCNQNEIDFYLQNCPNPNLLLKIK